jgi:hypothetical protein
VSITISADDPRSIRAIEIAARASDWRAARAPDGQPAFDVPSQTQPGHYYRVTRFSCECPDFQHATDRPLPDDSPDDRRACKHILAVRLYCELVRAQRSLTPSPATRRGHLRVVS